jgi:hypothetical protein
VGACAGITFSAFSALWSSKCEKRGKRQNWACETEKGATKKKQIPFHQYSRFARRDADHVKTALREAWPQEHAHRHTEASASKNVAVASRGLLRLAHVRQPATEKKKKCSDTKSVVSCSWGTKPSMALTALQLPVAAPFGPASQTCGRPSPPPFPTIACPSPRARAMNRAINTSASIDTFLDPLKS